MSKSIALFDFSHELSVQFHAGASNGLNMAAESTMRVLHEMRDYATHLVVCLDKPPYFRAELYPEYKGQRERLPEWHVIYRKALELLQADGFNIAAMDGMESDDVQATLAKLYYPEFEDIRLVTSDKDLMQCVNDRVTVHARARGGYEIRDLAWLAKSERFGFAAKSARKPEGAAVTPEQIPLFLAICGDKSDNIPGVAGIGPVNAAELIRKCWKGDALSTLGAITESMMKVHEAMAPLGKVSAVVTKWLAGCGAVGGYLKLTELRTDLPLDARSFLAPMPMRPGDTAATLPPDPELDRLEAEVMKAADIISSPVAQAPATSWLSFKSFLGGATAARVAGVAPDSAYALELLERFQQNLETIKVDNRGNPYTPEEKRVIAATSPKAPAASVAPSVASLPATPATSVAASSEDPRPVVLPATPPTFSTGPGDKGLAMLREPFPDHLISQLPKGTKAQNECAPSEKRPCNICGGWHHPKIVHLPYAGHAAVTDRLLEADIEWTWEPLATTPEGLPLLDGDGGLWIRLTVKGVSRLGYGHAVSKGQMGAGDRMKELIGDALRNAAMRFGAALELWHKGDLYGHD
jgi:5'-3' exonuclease